MSVIMKLAKTRKELSEAHELVKKTYGGAFGINLDELKEEKEGQFKHDVLIAVSSATNEILGTISIMYPNANGIFPCERFFGFNLKKSLEGKSKYVEIGRFATSDEGKQHHTVFISLLLGVSSFLKAKKINGWIATVKDDIFNFLQTIKLPIHNILQKPVLSRDNPLRLYVGDDASLHLFDVTSSETMNSFERFTGYITKRLIEIKIK
jgi:hypothetical protein